MGLSEIKFFNPHDKIIEYKLSKDKKNLCAMRLDAFIDSVSSKSPAPGGGSVAATAGALGVSLGMMVGALGIKNDETALSKLYAAAEKISTYLELLKASIDADTQAFYKIMSAVRLPKDTDESKKLRNDLLQNAYKKATLVPLDVSTSCVSAMESLVKIAELGNPKAMSDIGVGALMLYAGFEGAVLNVEINIVNISDKQFKKEVLEKLSVMKADIVKHRDLVLAKVKEVLLKIAPLN
jgi:glutamate formiminotransferase/formiminotetrahydrofolate cyclodeaminase